MERDRKLLRYLRIRDQLAGLTRGIEHPVARRATAAALIHHKTPGVSWTGFYLLHDGQLIVDAYQGPLACLKLAPHQGVCWAGIDRGQSVIVEDVHAFPSHIACDSRARSEIVVPLHGADGHVIGVLDVDSHHPAHFQDADREGLEAILRVVEGSVP
jgi:GAF domain-containing protein